MTKTEAAVDAGDKVSASLAFKKNLGNYQSLDVYASVSVGVRDGETEDEAYSRAWAIVERQLEAQLEKTEAVLKGE